MLMYVTIGSNDLARATPFYDGVMGALGHARLVTREDEIAYGAPGDKDATLFVVRPYDERAATVGNGSMTALTASTRAQVDAAHAAGMAKGGTDEGAPGLRAYGPNFYACYIRDPDGNKLSVVCKAAE